MIDSMKATHSGTCQVCGRLQKLPGTVLSKHGYTKKWGFFSGTCPGAGYKPFELDKAEIVKAIERVKGQVQQMNDEIANLPTLHNEATGTAPYRAYDSYRWTGYFETTCRVQQGESTVMLAIDMKNGEFKTEPAFRHSLHGDIAGIIFQLVSQRISRIQADIKQREEYIRWQESRISNWAPHPEKLIPVPAK